MNGKLLLVACLLSIHGTLSPAWAADSPQTQESGAEKIREERLFRSKSFPYRVLAFPRYLLELPWYPAKRFLDFSERTDLFNRITDLFYFNEAKTSGWFPNFSTRESSSSGGGVSLFHHDLFHKGHQADASLLYAAQDKFFSRAAYTIDPSTANPYFLKAEADYIRNSDDEIYTHTDGLGNPVLGPGTLRSDRSSFALTNFKGKAAAGKQLGKTLGLSFYVRGQRSRAGPGRGGFVPPSPNLAGFNEEIGLVGGGSRLVWDFRDKPVRPFYGCLVQAEAESVVAPEASASGDRFGYTQYALEAEHFLPIYDPHRVIVFRNSLRKADPLGGRKIPFYDLPILDENNLLRSFVRNRFRDRGTLSFNLEYRYPIWVTWDAFLFFDGGQAFGEFSDLRAPDFRYSEGLGVRFMSKDKLLFLLQFGTGREGERTQISLGQAF